MRWLRHLRLPRHLHGHRIPPCQDHTSQRFLFIARHLIVVLQPPRKDHLVIAVRAVHQHLLAEDNKVLAAVLAGRVILGEEPQATLRAVGEDALDVRLPVRVLHGIHPVAVLDLPRYSHGPAAAIKPEAELGILLGGQSLEHVSDDAARAARVDAIGERIEALLVIVDLIVQIADARELLCLLHGNSLLDECALLAGEGTNGSGG